MRASTRSGILRWSRRESSSSQMAIWSSRHRPGRRSVARDAKGNRGGREGREEGAVRGTMVGWKSGWSWKGWVGVESTSTQLKTNRHHLNEQSLLSTNNMSLYTNHSNTNNQDAEGRKQVRRVGGCAGQGHSGCKR